MKNGIKHNQKLNYNQKLLYNHFPLPYSIRVILFDEPEKIGIQESQFNKFITDFLIGQFDGYDNAYDWFYPFNMMVDWEDSGFQIMPQSESDYIEMPNVDGSMPENTTYSNRSFNVVLYSQDGLTINQKEELKSQISKILDTTKKSYKKLTLQPKETYFNVKYSGGVSVQEGPSFVKATIPFDVKPYGHPFFTQSITGSGTLTNNGLKECGPIIKISGPTNQPSFSVNGIQYTWKADVLKGFFLVLDFESERCYAIENDGGKKNEMQNLTPIDFPKINPGETCTISSSLGSNLTATIVESILW